MLNLPLHMSKRGKILIALSASLALLYSGVAWAVLRCCHDDAHSYQEHVLSSLDTEIASRAYSVDTDIECITPVYHTEAIAVSSLRSQIDPLTPGATSHGKDFFGLPAAYGDWVDHAWVGPVSQFARFFLVNTPLYLSLSRLRI